MRASFVGYPALVKVLTAAFLLAVTAAAQTYSLAYVKNGDLWVRAAGSVEARQITHSGHIFSPKFSVDGQFVAFEENRSTEKFAMDAVVSVLDLSKPDPIPLNLPGGYESCVWSPTEDSLAVWNGKGVYLFSERNSWSGQTIVPAEFPETTLVDAIFPPDGQSLLVSLRKHAGSDIYDKGLIDRVEIGGEHHMDNLVTEDSKGLEFYRFTPDGQTLLLWEDQDFSASIQNDGLQLYALSMQTHEIRPVLGANTMAFQDQISLSPDGKSLLTPAIFQDAWFMGRETWASRPLARIDLATGWKAVINGPYTSTLSPAWSPDGKSVAYVQAPTGQHNIGKRRIWIAIATGVRKYPLTKDRLYRDENPLWLSNDELLFCRVDAAFRASLWSIGRDGRNPAEVASLGTLRDEAIGFYGHVDWGDFFAVWINQSARSNPGNSLRAASGRAH